MVKQFSKSTLSLLLIGSILCSFGFGTSSTFNTQSNHQQVETSIDSHQDCFSGVVDDYKVSLNLSFTSFPEIDCEPEEDTKKKQRILQGYYFNGKYLTHHIIALSFWPFPLSASYLYHSSLYLLFEVFLC